MCWNVELSSEAQKQLVKLPFDVRHRIAHAIDQFEEKDDSQWSNIKALQGSEWRGRFRKRVGSYRIIFRKNIQYNLVEVSAILIKSKETYR
jgi:mRNA-degrading endonuclease RelE of RelBE toxin-antitoxin system